MISINTLTILVVVCMLLCIYLFVHVSKLTDKLTKSKGDSINTVSGKEGYFLFKPNRYQSPIIKIHVHILSKIGDSYKVKYISHYPNLYSPEVRGCFNGNICIVSENDLQHNNKSVDLDDPEKATFIEKFKATREEVKAEVDIIMKEVKEKYDKSKFV